MAETKFLIKKCTLIPNGCSLDEEYVIAPGVGMISYYESIESPTLAMTITFIDVDQVVSRKGLTGGELVELTVQDGDEDEFKITKKHRMMLNTVRDVITESNQQVATLDFVSMETIVNETARLNKKFTGNVSQTVEDILTNDKKGLQTKKELFKDEAVNSYSFIGNLKRPFDTIQWLCPKTQSSKEGFGFLFYENLDGYHFKSIENLLKQEAVRYQKSDRPLENDAKILENNLDQSNDIGMNCRMGMYANKTIYIDIENQGAKVVDFNIKKLKLKKELKLMDGLEESPTRLMVKASDVGVSQKGAKIDETTPPTELDEYKNKSYIRNNLLFSQSLSISIPLNTTLRAGDMIDIKLPVKKGDGESPTSSYGNEKSNDPSGKYLIAELRHTIGSKTSQTNLRLIRDVFTA
jgi:hypothetical protein|tara:strand:+ start:1313 stop:2536 length:1224 start_codon:yes stop_codon:yes gene_type:complete